MKLNVTALTGALVLALSAQPGQAATVSQAMNGFTITYDDAFLSNSGVSFNSAAGTITFSTSAFNLSAGLDADSFAYATNTFGQGMGGAGPIFQITASAGHLISGVTETLAGSYSGQAGDGGWGYAQLTYGARWVSSQDASKLMVSGYDQSVVAVDMETPQAQGTFSVPLHTAMAPAPTPLLVLSNADLTTVAFAEGPGAAAGVKLNTYTLQVNTVSSVPEPEALALLLAGVGVVGVSLKRRQTLA